MGVITGEPNCSQGTEFVGGHGHINDYDDDNNNGRWDMGEESGWGYWTSGGYAEVRGDAPDTGCGEGNVGDNSNGNGNGGGDGNGDGNGEGNGVSEETTQFTIVVVSGPGSGAPGDTLTFVVEVRKDGTAEPNQSVTFNITSGDGNATLGTPNPATTGNDGQAEIDLTLGNNAS